MRSLKRITDTVPKTMTDIIEITDFNAPELDCFARLSERELLNLDHPEKGTFIAESPKVTERALDAGYEPVSLLIEKSEINDEAERIISKCGSIPVFTSETEILSQITGFKMTRGLLCAMKRKPLPGVADICKNASRVAVLENVMNPTNIGAIFRNAAALGFDAVLLTSGCSDPLYRRAIRVSMGTVFQIPWTIIPKSDCSQTENEIGILKEMGFATAAMSLKPNSVNIDNKELNSEEKLAIVLGTEGDGLALSTIAECDYNVMIPMAHGVDSLNVSSAAAVAFWQLGKK